MLYVISPEQLGEVVKKVVEEITTEKKDTSMDKFLTVNEVVSNLGVSRTTLWRWEKYNLHSRINT